MLEPPPPARLASGLTTSPLTESTIFFTSLWVISRDLTSSTSTSINTEFSALTVKLLTKSSYCLPLYSTFIFEFSFNLLANDGFSCKNTRENLTLMLNWSSLFSNIYLISASSSRFSAAVTSEYGALMPVITNFSPFFGLKLFAALGMMMPSVLASFFRAIHNSCLRESWLYVSDAASSGERI